MVVQGSFDPEPTNLEVTCATEPMRVDPTALALGDHLNALSDEVEGGHRQDLSLIHI